MFDLLALLTLLASLMAPIDLGIGPESSFAARGEDDTVTASDDGSMPPPGRR